MQSMQEGKTEQSMHIFTNDTRFNSNIKVIIPFIIMYKETIQAFVNKKKNVRSRLVL